MPELSGFPYVEAEFTKEGELHPPERAEAVLGFLRTAAPTDLLVLAHGWNNDMADARQLYAALTASMGSLAGGPERAGRRLAVLGLLWPSKKFADEALIPGGGVASLTGPGEDLLEAKIDRLQEAVRDEAAPGLEDARAALPDLEDDPEARRRFVEALRRSLEPADAPEEDASDRFFTGDPEELFRELDAPILMVGPPGESGGVAAIGEMVDEPMAGADSGEAAGLGAMFSGVRAAAARLLNYATYYQMKARAGTVGGGGVATLLRTVRGAFPDLRIHLAGHSFGARVVTAAALAAGPEVRPASLTLLQGAFSHNGFSGGFRHEGKRLEGFFRRVLTAPAVAGPIVVTHTANDKAVGVLYAIASRFAGQATSGLGDAGDVFGGLGRNGAVNTDESEFGELLSPDAPYRFRPGTVHNLRSDRFIRDHSDVTGKAVAHALLGAIGWPA